MAKTYEYKSEAGKTASVYILQDVLAKPEPALIGQRILSHAISGDGLRPADLADIRARHPEGTLYAVRVMQAAAQKGVKGGSRWGAEAPAKAEGMTDRAKEAVAALKEAKLTGEKAEAVVAGWVGTGDISAEDARWVRLALGKGSLKVGGEPVKSAKLKVG